MRRRTSSDAGSARSGPEPRRTSRGGPDSRSARSAGRSRRSQPDAGGGVPAVQVRLDDGVVGLVLADDLEPTRDPSPWVALVPALDATTMGWTDRRFFLGDHGPRLFDRNGNAGPTVWVDDRIVGGWAQRPDGRVVTSLFEDVGAEARRAVEARAADLETWLRPSRVIPRFRTPLEFELSAAG